jgi:hypothetical protein
MKQNLRIGVCEVNTSGTSEHPQAKVTGSGESHRLRRDYSFLIGLPIRTIPVSNSNTILCVSL